MAPPIVYDGLRLFIGPISRTPRGIDRVDLAYARYLFGSWPADCVGLLPTPWGVRQYDRRLVLRALDRLELLWRETAEARANAAFDEVRRRLNGTMADGRTTSSAWGIVRRQASMFAANGVTLGRPIRATAHGSIYVNVGQLGWAARWNAAWLRKRADMRAVYLLHDVIPLEHQGLVSRLGHLAHRRMVDVAAERAAGLILTTEAATASVLNALRARAVAIPRMVTLPLPVAPVFLTPRLSENPLPGQPYFLVCGSIEPRKNLLMLARVWRALVAGHGAAAPLLVIVGSPGHGGGPILEQLRREGPAVITVSGLSSPGLRQLMDHAQALLMPSLAEGFGMPITEALAVGTPVLASDLPAHREVGGAWASYLNGDDEAGWLAGVEILLDRSERVAGYVPMTGERYFERVKSFLEGI